MSLLVASLNSGSNGNCYYIGNGDVAVLIDAGISSRETEKRMKQLGLSLKRVKGIFITHEHSDHIGGVAKLSKRHNIPVFITAATRLQGNLKLEDSLCHAFKPHETITIEVAADADLQTKRSGNVKIVFTELPVAEWHQLSNDEKRARAITNGGGVSIVRGKREVDFGWFFMGTKRRESYDDWWRCEIRFDPALDDAFGISHTKQQIRPSENLVEALTPIIEDTAKALNSRARHKYLVLKTEKNYGEAEKIAARHHGRLRPISKRAGLARDTNLLADLANRNVRVRDALADDNVKPKYLIVPDDQVSEPFYKAVISDRLLVAVLNSNHLFYRKLYEPLVNQSALESGKMALIINLMLLSAIRAEASFNGRDERKLLAKFRKEWSDVFDALLRS